MIDKILQGLIRLYQIFVSPILPANCRYMPSCSCYAISAIKIHGSYFGLWLIIRRLLRCHPFGGSGYDPVPDKTQKQIQNKTQFSQFNNQSE